MTTILAVKKKNKIAIGGDGQLTINNTIIKNNVEKIKSIYNNSVLIGLSGNTIDAINLYKNLEIHLKYNNGNLLKSSVDLVNKNNFIKSQAMIIAINKYNILLISNTGDIIKPDNNIIAIGSGSNFAQSAAVALFENTNLSAYDIVYKSLYIASNYCIYTNKNFIIKELII